MLLATHLRYLAYQSANNTTNAEVHTTAWEATAVAFICANVLFTGFDVAVVSYLSITNRIACLPYLHYSALCLFTNILVLPFEIIRFYFVPDHEAIKYSYVVRLFGDICYDAAALQLLYIYFERFLKMHYPFRFRSLATVRQQNLAVLVNVVIGVIGNMFIIFLIVEMYNGNIDFVQLVGDQWPIAQKYPAYRILFIVGNIVNPFLPALGTTILVWMNNRKLASLANFSRIDGCWDLRNNSLMSIRAWIHEEVRLCTSLALLHTFQFVPVSLFTIIYYEENFDFFHSQAYTITMTVIGALELPAFSLHVPIFIAFCPGYRQFVFKTFSSCIKFLSYRYRSRRYTVTRWTAIFCFHVFMQWLWSSTQPMKRFMYVMLLLLLANICLLMKSYM